MKITSPTLLIDKPRVLNNIKRILEKTKRSQVLFRPHFKTHQSAGVGKWFRELGVTAITVSSVGMAAYFAKNGWNDITIAFIVNPLEIDEINRLAGSIKLGLLVDSEAAISFLNKGLKGEVDAWLKIDSGYGRTGVRHDEEERIINLAHKIKRAEKLRFKGILTHAGHSYRARSISGIKQIYQDTLDKLSSVKKSLLYNGFIDTRISIGDTPTCSVADQFKGIDEVRCGNFVFYDIMQFFIGSCVEEDLAAALACPVVGRYPKRKEWVVYGGAIHLSKDFIEDNEGRKIYGLVSLFRNSAFSPIIKQAYVSQVTQEHGVIRSRNRELENVNVGDILLIFPVHSCLTVNLMQEYYTLTEERIPIMGRALD